MRAVSILLCGRDGGLRLLRSVDAILLLFRRGGAGPGLTSGFVSALCCWTGGQHCAALSCLRGLDDHIRSVWVRCALALSWSVVHGASAVTSSYLPGSVRQYCSILPFSLWAGAGHRAALSLLVLVSCRNLLTELTEFLFAPVCACVCACAYTVQYSRVCVCAREECAFHTCQLTASVKYLKMGGEVQLFGSQLKFDIWKEKVRQPRLESFPFQCVPSNKQSYAPLERTMIVRQQE